MSQSKSIFFNTSALFAATALSRIISIPISALLVRALTQKAFGQYSYYNSFAGIFAVLATFGIPTYLSREIVQQPERAPILLKTGFVLQWVLSALTLLVTLWVGGVGRLPNEIWWLFLATIGTIGVTTATLFQYAMSGIQRSYLSAAVQVISSLATTLGFLLVVLFKPDLEATMWVIAFSGVSQYVLSYFVLWRYCPTLRLASGWPRWVDYRQVAVDSLPYVFLVAFNTLYFRIDVVLLKAWSTVDEIANYAAAYKFIEIVSVLVGVIGLVTFAEFSNMYARGDERMGRSLRQGFRYMVIFSLPLSAFGSFYARDFLELFYADKYLQSVPMLQILAWTTVFLFARNLQTVLIQSYSYITVQVAVYAASTLLNVGLNYFLIPVQGGLGASIATLACEMFNFIAFSYFLHFKLQLVIVDRWLFLALSAFAAMCGVLWLSATLLVPFRIGLGMLTFVGVLYLTGGVLPEDLELLKQLRKKLRRRIV